MATTTTTILPNQDNMIGEHSFVLSWRQMTDVNTGRWSRRASVLTLISSRIYDQHTWARWTSVMVFSIVSQVSICINVNTLEPFITNVIRDHKAKKMLSNEMSNPCRLDVASLPFSFASA